MTKKQVPLFFGEGPDRKEIGVAYVDGHKVTCTITDSKATGLIRPQEMQHFSFGVNNEGLSIDHVPVEPDDFSSGNTNWVNKIYNAGDRIFTPGEVMTKPQTPTTHHTAENLQKKAIGLVADYYNTYVLTAYDDLQPIVDTEIFVVWFCKTLQNWKALVSTHRPDNRYYEVTYDGDKKRTYIDQYDKVDNTTVEDEVKDSVYQTVNAPSFMGIVGHKVEFAPNNPNTCPLCSYKRADGEDV